MIQIKSMLNLPDSGSDIELITALDEPAVQIEREAQRTAERAAVERHQSLAIATAVLLGCALAVTLGLLARKRRTDAASSRA